MPEITKKQAAWRYAIDMNKIDGLEPSPELSIMIKKEIEGRMTDDEIIEALKQKYGKRE